MPEYTNGGSQVYMQLTNTILLSIKVHFIRNSMANILLFKDVSSIKGARINMDTAEEMGITVKLTNNKFYKLEQYENDL